METLNIIMVAGDWTENGVNARPSSVMQKLAAGILHSKPKLARFEFYNGGNYSDLSGIYSILSNFDIVLWFPNIDNSLPKLGDIKEKYPYITLVTSKNNISGKYSFEELIQKALVKKSNLMIEITQPNSELRYFRFRLFDPLMNVFFYGGDPESLGVALMNRLQYLHSITRQRTYQAPEDKSLILKWYFDQFSQDFEESDRQIAVPEMQEFIDLVHNYADVFSELMPHGCNQERFIGNCSVKPHPVIGRCSKSMPSFKKDGMVFVSKRNIDKAQIQLEHFVPVYTENGKIKYCGKDKPSVDTPMQLKLYEALPNINCMIHSHCYIKPSEKYTTWSTCTVNPCGAVEEADEILRVIDDGCGTRECKCYLINLKGHGSIIMGYSVDSLRDIEFVSRPSPEYTTNVYNVTTNPY